MISSDLKPARHRALFVANTGLMSARIMGAWLDAGHEIAEIWIGPVNRRRHINKNWDVRLLRPRWSVAALAARHGIPVRAQPVMSRWPDARAEILRTGADTLITSVTMQIVPGDILALFSGRAVNFHPALLPHYRGPGPRQGMVIDRTYADYAGITAHCLTAGIDEGDIIGQRPVPMDPRAPFDAWDLAVAEAAAAITRNELQDYLRGARAAVPQDPAAGSYRRVGPHELTIGPRTSARQAEWLCRMLGATGGVLVDAPDTRHGHYKVDRFLREEGPPSGVPVKAGPGAVSLDVADARITLRRRTAWTRRLRRLERLRALYAHDRARDA